MHSTVTKLYDYRQEPIPAELRLWRIQDAEIRQKLEVLSKDYAYEEEAQTVQNGDSVRCRSISDNSHWNRSVLLLYPGEGICPLEEKCIGMGLGERRKIFLGNTQVTIIVEKILRRSNMPISDTLVKAENIEGVTTLDAYYDWYRETNGPQRRQFAAMKLAYHLLKAIAEKSVYSIDHQEETAWVSSRTDMMYTALVVAGIDPTIPKEGFDFLTEEQAKANMFQENLHFFREYVAQAALVEKLSGESVEEHTAQRLPAFAAANGVTVEALVQQSGYDAIYSKFAMDIAIELLCNYTNTCLED